MITAQKTHKKLLLAWFLRGLGCNHDWGFNGVDTVDNGENGKTKIPIMRKKDQRSILNVRQIILE